MRIWDVDPKHLCRNHLLGEHRELHAIWSIITSRKQGYRNHPETKRWQGKLKALYRRHDALIREMGNRGYLHRSVLDQRRARGKMTQNVYLESVGQQRARLRKKRCGCFVRDFKEKGRNEKN